jgi:hypothetical protein
MVGPRFSPTGRRPARPPAASSSDAPGAALFGTPIARSTFGSVITRQPALRGLASRPLSIGRGRAPGERAASFRVSFSGAASTAGEARGRPRAAAGPRCIGSWRPLPCSRGCACPLYAARRTIHLVGPRFSPTGWPARPPVIPTPWDPSRRSRLFDQSPVSRPVCALRSAGIETAPAWGQAGAADKPPTEGGVSSNR